MIEVQNVTKRYGEHTALSDVSFIVPKGHIVGFLGVNGAGKTTTMDIICGCIGSDQGSATISGFDITDKPLDAKKRLGYLPDIPPLYPDMKVSEFITYAAKIHQVPKDKMEERIEFVLDHLSLKSVNHRLVGNLSKGFRQRVALAQALVHDPEVLVLDEPTEGLDPGQIVQIRELIKSLKGKHTVLLSSHILSEVENTCDYIIIINKGKIVAKGTYAEITEQQAKASHVQYHLRVARKSDEILKHLKSISTINVINVTEGTHAIDFTLGLNQSEEIIEKIASEVVNKGYGLRELTRKSTTLEDVFLDLTTQNKN